MSVRSRAEPWFRPPRAVAQLRYWKLCSDWTNESGNKWMFAATRPATTKDVPEAAVARVFGETSAQQ